MAEGEIGRDKVLEADDDHEEEMDLDVRVLGESDPDKASFVAHAWGLVAGVEVEDRE